MQATHAREPIATQIQSAAFPCGFSLGATNAYNAAVARLTGYHTCISLAAIEMRIGPSYQELRSPWVEYEKQPCGLNIKASFV